MAPCQGPAGTFLLQSGVIEYICSMLGFSRYFSPSERVHGVHLLHARVQQVLFSFREGSWSTFAPCQGPAGTFLLQRGFMEYILPCQGPAGTFLLQSGVMEYICALLGFSRYFSPSERVHGVHLRHARVQQVCFSFREGSWSMVHFAMPGSSRYVSRGFMEYISPCQGPAGTFLLQRGFMEYICAMLGFSRYISSAMLQMLRLSIRSID